mgnify:CR=1 FL=1
MNTIDHAAVHHPAHYQGRDGVEVIDVIEAMVGVSGHANNAIKYILRHKQKGRPAEDLAKARWYIVRLSTSRERIEAQPTVGINRLAIICDAFGLEGHPRAALANLHDALVAKAEDRYRAHLRDCAFCLDREIDRLERLA